MKEVEIFVEGTIDRIFLAQYLELVLGFEITITKKDQKEKNRVYKFVRDTVEGYISLLHNYKKIKGPLFQSRLNYNNNNDIVTLLLLDADKTKEVAGDLGGFEKRLEWLKTVPQIESCPTFLIPNDEDDGYVETILGRILTDAYQPVRACLEQQDDCLRAAEARLPDGATLQLKPSEKAEKEFMRYLRQIVKSDNDYSNATIWNLNHPYLEPLKTFLETHLH